MSCYNSPTSFRDEEILFPNVPEEWLQPSGYIEHLRNKLECSLAAKRETYKEQIRIWELKILSVEDEIKKISEKIENAKIQKNVLNTNIIRVKQTLSELQLKKKALEESECETISQEELSIMLDKVVTLETENERKKKELVKHAKALVGLMCFYKEYLDVYVEICGEEEFIFYFRRSKGTENNKPKEWIRIRTRTDNFEEYVLVDVSLPEDSEKRQELFTRSNDRIPLLKLVVLAREYCLSYSNL